MWVERRAISTMKHSSALDLEGLVIARWLREFETQPGLNLECSPYEAPDIAKLVRVEFPKSAGDVVCYPYVFCIIIEIMKS